MRTQSIRRRLLTLWAVLAILMILRVTGYQASAANFSILSPSQGDSFNYGEEVEFRVSTSFYAWAYISGFQLTGPNHIVVEILKDGTREAFFDFGYVDGSNNSGSYPRMGSVMTEHFTPQKTGTYTVRAEWHGILGDHSVVNSPDITFTFKVTKAKVSKINITGIHNLAPGTSYTLHAEVLPENAYNKTLKWTSSNTSVATVNQNGVVKVKSNAGGKSVNIVAAATDGSAKKKTWKIKVPKKKVKSITIIRPKTMVYPGEEMQLSATVTPDKNTVSAVTWSVDHPEWCELSPTGVIDPYTAGKGQKIRITATAADGSEVTKTTTVRIGDALQAFTTDLVKGKIQISSCGLTKWTQFAIPITVGDQLAFLQGASASISKISYASSNGKVLSVSNKSGIATAKKAGTVKVTITVTKTNKKKVTASLKFTVEEPCKYPYTDECSCRRYGLVVNGKEIQAKHEPFKEPEGSENYWTYGPVEEILKALDVKYVKTADGSAVGGTLNGHTFVIKDGATHMDMDGSSHGYLYGAQELHAGPVMYEDVLFCPANFFDCFAEDAKVENDGQFVRLDLKVDQNNSGAYGITKDDLK